MRDISTYIAFLLLFATVTSCSSQNAEQEGAGVALDNWQNIDSIISHIKCEYQAINKSTSFKKKQIDLAGLSTEGAEVFAYIDGRVLRKATATYYGEMGKRTDEYYFEGGTIFFLFQQTIRYDKPIYIEGSKTINTEEDRCYFHEGRLVKWINKENETVDPISKEAAKKAQDIQEIATIIKEAATSNNINLDSSE